MANIKSQIKRNRQNETRRLRNKSIRSELKTAVKKAETALGDSDLSTAAKSKIDSAVSKGVLHKRTAARKKSRLAKRVSTTG